MANFYSDNDDLRFYFEEGIDWTPIAELAENGFRLPDGHKSLDEAVGFYRDVAGMIGEFVAEEIAPHIPAIDREGVRIEKGEAILPARLDAIFRKIKDLELHGMCLPRELGGMNAPLLLYFAQAEMLGRADPSVTAHHEFHGGMALALLMYSISEGTTTFDPTTRRIVSTRFRAEIEEILGGRAWGCMVITEPDAGSDMAALRASGEPDAQGNWFVTGQKTFITSGHGRHHFVIARTEPRGHDDSPLAGLGGLSLFLVRAYDDHPDGTRTRYVTIDRAEEKLGHHASATLSLSYDRSPAQLIGKRGEGFKYMLMLMNSARFAVGFEAIGICEACYRLARDYAAQRPSMGKMIDRHEMIADYLDEMRTDIQGLRAMGMWGAAYQEMAEKINLRLLAAPPADELERERLQKQVQHYRRRARRVTPLLKYLAAEKAVEMSRRCLQIHGGNGYIKEYGAEKLLRDAVVLPIYEGTSQIQSLMAMKDTITLITRNPQKFLRRVAQARWLALSAADPLARRVSRVQSVSLGAQQHLITRIAAGKLKSLRGKPMTEWPHAFLTGWSPKRDFGLAMLHAERLTRILADELICKVLLEQVKQHPSRRDVLLRYLERCEPRVNHLAEVIATTGDRLLAELAEPPASDEAAGS